MSVTFYAKGFINRTIPCTDCNGDQLWNNAQSGEDQSQALTVMDACTCDYGRRPLETPTPELNMSQGNVRALLLLLGYPCSGEDHWCGEFDAATLLVMICIARKAQHIEFSRSAVADGNAYNCGLSTEQLVRYLDDLATVAHFAIENETPVVWA